MTTCRLLLAALLLTLAGSGCGGDAPPEEAVDEPPRVIEIRVAAAQDGASTALKVGHVLRVELPASPEAGRAWELASVDETVLRIPVEEYVPPDAPGEPGTSVWRFEAVGPGTTTLVLHTLDFSGDEPVEERTFSFRVLVD